MIKEENNYLHEELCRLNEQYSNYKIAIEKEIQNYQEYILYNKGEQPNKSSQSNADDHNDNSDGNNNDNSNNKSDKEKDEEIQQYKQEQEMYKQKYEEAYEKYRNS